MLRAIRCPVLNIWASGGILPSRSKLDALVCRAEDLLSDYERLELQGDHHLHLDPQAAGQIAEAMLVFLDRRGLR